MNLETLDRQIEEYSEKNHIYGMIRVTVRDEIVYKKSLGLADFEKNIPFTDDSMFTFYSISKPFCAIGLLLLRDRGLVDIDAHPSKYLPEAAKFDERVTIRHMLHHNSGLPDYEQVREFAAKYAPGTYEKLREHTRLISEECPMYFAPGEGGHYANINFVLSALIIENVTGLPYAEYMQKAVFEPLGMRAVVDDGVMEIPNKVTGYEFDGEKLYVKDKSYNWLFGAGDIVGTVDDVYCLNKAYKNRPLLSESTWNEVLTPSPRNSMGMGNTIIEWHGKRRVHHNGGHLGFRTFHIWLPDDDFDFIFLSNSGFGNARDDYAEMIHNAFYGDSEKPAGGVAMDAGYIK